MNSFINPFRFFALVQLAPLFLWLFLPEEMLAIALQGYKKPSFSLLSLGIYAILILSFYVGYRASFLIKKTRSNSPVEQHIGFVRILHNTAFFLTAVSIFFVGYTVIAEGLNVFEILRAGNGNIFKSIVYSGDGVQQIRIMARHLILTCFVTWFVLNIWDRKPRTLILLIMMGCLLFLFTSSRLTLMGITLVAGLFSSKQKNSALSSGILKLIGIGIVMIVVFGIAVLSRSVETWRIVTGSNNIAVIIAGEFLGYFLSPVNYSVALVEYSRDFYTSSILSTLFSFIITLFNVESFLDTSYLKDIETFYNPSLNQIGLIGQWYTGFGPFLAFPSFFLGLTSGLAYLSFNKNELWGLILYPLFFISLFDSFRGFLLFQNVIASNLLFIFAFMLLVNLRHWFRINFKKATVIQINKL